MRLRITASAELPCFLEAQLRSAAVDALARGGYTLPEYWRALQAARPKAGIRTAIAAAEQAAAQVLAAASPATADVDVRISIVGAAPPRQRPRRASR